jgi:hypothetical protein
MWRPGNAPLNTVLYICFLINKNRCFRSPYRLTPRAAAGWLAPYAALVTSKIMELRVPLKARNFISWVIMRLSSSLPTELLIGLDCDDVNLNELIQSEVWYRQYSTFAVCEERRSMKCLVDGRQYYTSPLHVSTHHHYLAFQWHARCQTKAQTLATSRPSVGTGSKGQTAHAFGWLKFQYCGLTCRYQTGITRQSPFSQGGAQLRLHTKFMCEDSSSEGLVKLDSLTLRVWTWKLYQYSLRGTGSS